MAIASHLASVGATRDVLSRHGLATKHSLGQNFLVNDAVIANICKLSEVCEEDNVLEWARALAADRSAFASREHAIAFHERDPDLPAVLDETCDDFDNFTLIGKDALRLNGDDLIAAFGKQAVEASEAPNKFISNLPYAVAATLVSIISSESPACRAPRLWCKARWPIAWRPLWARKITLRIR